MTASLLLAVYAVVNGNEAGWTSAQSLSLLGAAALLMALFLAIEARSSDPLMPLSMFRLRNLATANVVAVLWPPRCSRGSSCRRSTCSACYDAMQVGLAFLPGNLIMAVFSLGLSAKLVMRFGIRGPLAWGWRWRPWDWRCSRAPIDGSFTLDVLPAMVLLGLGAGVAFNPMLLAAMSDVEPSRSGLASGLVNTAFMMGGALGLAALASLARARGLAAAGAARTLNGGYQATFLAGALIAGVAALLSAALVRTRNHELARPAGDTPPMH